jgi:MYXO-CTERM domain-containing protein
MRRTIAVTAATGALLFGGAGVANATVPSGAAIPSSATTTLADNNNTDNHHSDKTGLWGLVGLAGLAGLAGLVRRRDDHHLGTTTARPGGTTTAGPGAPGQTPTV